MGDDLDGKMKQISELLSDANMQHKVKNLLSSLTTNNGSSSDFDHPKVKENMLTKSSDDSLESILKMKFLFDRLSKVQDPKINLINAIKPFISISSHSKLDHCVKILQMVNMVKLLDDPEIRGGQNG